MKILYFDVETTGTDSTIHNLTQLAGMIEIDGEVVEEFNLDVQPLKFDTISSKALEITGKTVEELRTYPTYPEAYKSFMDIVQKHVNKFDKEDKLYPCGYNVQFDIGFLRQFFLDNNDKFYGSLMNYKYIDPLGILYYLEYLGAIKLSNYKLSTVCEHFEIPIDAHDAMSDIRATRELLKLLNKQLV